MKICGRTKVCGVIGDPIGYSLSPIMHNAAFERLNLDFVYVAFRIKADELGDAMVGMKGLGIRGLNVTMPHKGTVIKYLDEIDLTARSIGAVNTILNDDGRLVGYNTDGIGALKSLKENGISLNGTKLLLLGAGGAGKAIAFCIAQEVDELVILNRNVQKAKKLAKFLRKEFNKKITAGALLAELIRKELSDANILINATSVGMHPNTNSSLVDLTWLRPDLCVMDIIYDPIVTKLIKDAKSVGARVVSGIDMLIHQGADSFEIWTNHPAPVEIMKQAIFNELSQRGFSIEGES